MESQNEAERQRRRKLFEVAVITGSDILVRVLLQVGVESSFQNFLGQTPIYIASRRGHVQVLRLLVEAGGDIHSPDFEGRTPLYSSAFDGHIEEARFLHDLGASVLQENKYGTTPLNLACMEGHLELATFFLDNGADIEKADEFLSTSLHSAICSGFIDLVNLLVSRGASITTPDSDGWTPVASAASHGYTDIVKLLLDNGADPETKNDQGCTALASAVTNGYYDAFKLLLEHGSSTSPITNDGETILLLAASEGHVGMVTDLLVRGCDLSVRCSEHGDTPLCAAAHEGHLEVVTLLAQHGANLSDRDNEGWTLLSLAAMCGHTDVVEFLLDKGANCMEPNDAKSVPLHIAARNGHLPAAKLLLQKGAEIEARNADSCTALFLAAFHGHLDVVTFLLEHKADPDARDEDGRTALLEAAIKGYDDIMRLLILYGADVNAETRQNKITALAGACDHGKFYAAKILLEHGAHVSPRGSTGETPLSIVSELGHVDIAKLLIDSGADTTPKNRDGWTPLHWAAWCGHVDIVECLLDSGADIDCLTNTSTTPLNLAGHRGHIDTVKLLLGKGADLSLADRWDHAALFGATIGGNVDVIKLLVEHGADLTVRNIKGSTLLTAAVLEGRVDVVRQLLLYGESIAMYNSDGSTALICACGSNQVEVLKVLIESGFDVNEPSEAGYAAINVASEAGNLEIVEILLKHGSHIGLSRRGFTTLHVASAFGHVNVAKALLAHGAEINAPDCHGNTSFYAACANGKVDVARFLLENGADMLKKNNSGASAIHSAARFGRTDVLELLLEKGASIGERDKFGSAPLALASGKCHVETVRMLLRNGANPADADEMGRRAIHEACDEGHVEIVELLLDHGSNLMVADEQGLTPITIACCRGHVDLTKVLIEKFPDPSIAERDGRPVLTDGSFLAAYLGTAMSFPKPEPRQGNGNRMEPISQIPMMQRHIVENLQAKIADAVEAGSPKENGSVITVETEIERSETKKCHDDGRSDSNDSHWRNVLYFPPGSSDASSELSTPEPNSLCDVCRRIFDGTVKPIPVDYTSQIRGFISTLMPKADVLPKLTPDRESISRAIKIYCHHLSAISLREAWRRGCHICKRLWGRYSPEIQQRLIDSDLYTRKRRTGIPAYSLCALMDFEVVFDGLDIDTGPLSRLWLPGLHPDLDNELNTSIADRCAFTFVSLHAPEASRYDPANPVPTNTSSPESLSFAAKMFQDCIANHKECKTYLDTTWLPTRLVHIGDKSKGQRTHLVLGNDVEPGTAYSTLSHCWGNSKFFSLNRTNLDELLCEIDEAQLPKSFSDSLVVASRLDIAYIWIDSLCIVQDDEQDWLNEASQMHRVYMNSVCNICATGSMDSTQGLFRSREPDIFKSCDVTIPWLNNGGEFRVVDTSTWAEEVTQAPLNKRAWVAQELLLAPRQLHFGASQILWQCIESCACEQYPDGLPDAIAIRAKGVQSARQQLRRPELIHGDADQHSKIRSDWRAVAENYMRRKLTYDRDRVMALDGIIQRYASLLGDEFVAGIWRSDALRGLLWSVEYCRHGGGVPSRRPIKARAPSFSWLSIEGDVKMQVDKDAVLLARILDMNVHHDRGVSWRGSIRLRGKLIRHRVVSHNSASGKAWMPLFQYGKPELGWVRSMSSAVYLDIDGEHEGIMYTILISIGINLSGLVLEETGNAVGEFRRIGYLEGLTEDKAILRMPMPDQELFPCELYDADEGMHTITIV